MTADRPSRLGEMRGDVPGAAWPSLFSSRHASLVALVAQLEKTQFWSAEEIEAAQRKQLTKIARHYETHSTWFRERLAHHGLTVETLGQPGGLQKLPLLYRREAQDHFAVQHVTALPPGHVPTNRANTSGSTGEPVIVWKTAVNRLIWLAMQVRYYLWNEPDFEGRYCAIRANQVSFGEAENWGDPMASLFDTGPLMMVSIETDIAKQIEVLRDFKSNSLLIYPSNLAWILDALDSVGTSLPDLRRVHSLGETLSPELIARAAADHGLTIRDNYSTDEVGYVALQCPDGDGYHVMAESLIVEVLRDDGSPCSPGEVGRVVITDLHNHATPLFRYVIGDMAEAGHPCSCGRGLPTLGRIQGRTRNMIVKPDGTRHWPLVGNKGFRAIAPVTQFQFIQTSLEKIEVKLATERPLTEAEEAALTKHIHDKLGYPFALAFSYYPDGIPLGPNGKFEEFKSLIAGTL